MLPFLKPKNKNQGIAGIAVKVRTPDEAQDPENTEDSSNAGLESAMQELHSHLNAGNYKEAAECFRNAFQMCEDEPHEEGPHIEKHSYEDQNQEAGE